MQASVIVTGNEVYTGVAQKTENGYKIYTEDGPKIIKNSDIEEKAINSSEASTEEVDRFIAGTDRYLSSSDEPTMQNTLAPKEDLSTSVLIETWNGKKYQGIAKDKGLKVELATKDGLVTIDKFNIKNNETMEVSQEDLDNYNRHRSSSKKNESKEKNKVEAEQKAAPIKAEQEPIKKPETIMSYPTRLFDAKTRKWGLVELEVTPNKDFEKSQSSNPNLAYYTIANVNNISDVEVEPKEYIGKIFTIDKSNPVIKYNDLKIAHKAIQETKVQTMVQNGEGFDATELTIFPNPKTNHEKDKALYFTITEANSIGPKSSKADELVGRTFKVSLSLQGSQGIKVVKEILPEKDAKNTKDLKTHTSFIQTKDNYYIGKAQKLKNGYLIHTEEGPVFVQEKEITAHKLMKSSVEEERVVSDIDFTTM